MAEVVHMIAGDVMPLSRMVSKVRTRCGRNIDQPMIDDGDHGRYELIAHNGNVFQCTTTEQHVTCVKCLNLIKSGTIYAPTQSPSRAADAKKRGAVADADATPARAAGAHRNPVGRPKGGRLRPDAR